MTTTNETCSAEINISIGIDFGTTFCCVSYWNQYTGTLELIPSMSGNNTFPSIIAFIDGKIIVGEEAASWKTLAPESILWEIKRFIGRTFNDSRVQEDKQHVTYLIRETPNEPESIQLGIKNYSSEDNITDENNVMWVSPLEASSIILKYLRETVNKHLNADVKNAVITVPAYFGDLQREAIKLAAELANLNVLRIIPEPTAAALAYHNDFFTNTGKNILVFDWGGGTLDVSLLTMENTIVEVIAIDGDHHLGGEDIDNIILRRVWQKFAAQLLLPRDEHNEYPNLSKSHSNELRCIIEKAKRILSIQDKTRIEWNPTHVLFDLDIIITDTNKALIRKPVWITRNELEEWCDGLFLRAMTPVNRIIRDVSGRFSETEIDEVLLVGGTTRIPAIQELLVRRFPCAHVHQRVHPDECVGRGAGIQSALLTGIRHDNLKNVLLLDVSPFSLGIETIGGVMTRLLERNTTLPAYARQIFTTEVDEQVSVYIMIYQGERAFVVDNQLLGRFELSGIPLASRGVPRIEVTFEVDVNGILLVSAVEQVSHKKCCIRIQSNPGGISEEERMRLINDTELFRTQDKNRKELSDARLELQDFFYNVCKTIKDNNNNNNNTKNNNNNNNNKHGDEINMVVNSWRTYIEIEMKSAPTSELTSKLSELRKITHSWIDLLK